MKDITLEETIEANRLTCELITARLGAPWIFDQYVNPMGNLMYRLKHLQSGQSANSNSCDHPEEIAVRLRAIIECGKSGIISPKDYQPFLRPLDPVTT